MRWIDTKEGLLVALKDSDMAISYQEYCDDVERGIEDDVDIDPNTGKEIPLEYEDWLPGFLEQLEFEKSPEFRRFIGLI